MAAFSPDEECWEYVDPKQLTRGPFSSKTMAAWYDARMLPEDLTVRYSKAMPFVKIKDLFPAPLEPFRSKPRQNGPQAPAQWQYCDTKGVLQGPFTSAQMVLWFEHKMLPKDLQLRRTTDVTFATIDQYFPRPLVPFRSPPVTPVPRKEPNHGLGITTGGGAAVMKPELNHRPAATHDSKVAMASLQTTTAPAPVQPIAASQPAPAPAPAPAVQPLPAQPREGKGKEKGKGKGGKSGHKSSEAAEAGEAEEYGGHKGVKEGGKENGKGKAGRGRNGRQAAKAQQAANWGWSGPEWSGSDKWWEWQSWDWSGEASWEHGEGSYGHKKGGGSEWKGNETPGAPVGASPPKEKGEKSSAAQQQQNGFGLKWGPKAEAVDLFPEAWEKRVLDEGIIWEERWVSPLAVRFSQGKIHPFFHERGPISEVLLQIHCTDTSGNIKRIEPPFPPMRLLHLKQQGVLVTLDNRRLYALQKFALQEWPAVCLAKALCVDELTPTRLKAENRKFTNRVGGLQIEIESRSNAFDKFSWVTEAAHIETPRFCRPIAFKAVDKALSLLPVMIVHLLLCPRMRPIIRSLWPLLELVARTLRSPQRREFPAKRLMLLHVLELARTNRQARTGPQVCVGFQMETVVTLSKGKSCVTSKHNVTRPLTLIKAPPLTSPVQAEVLRACLPFFCLPYARTVLRGKTQEWIVGFLLAWGKVSISMLKVPPPP
mmetsp:Transcript_100664/g.174792  ORF Transcript_100664/g.174792 Transcript_100664/m.174792 type:complete len:709 (-) Transcript_100664:99-2225(-)